jgi:hypothetical protein
VTELVVKYVHRLSIPPELIDGALYVTLLDQSFVLLCYRGVSKGICKSLPAAKTAFFVSNMALSCVVGLADDKSSNQVSGASFASCDGR